MDEKRKQFCMDIVNLAVTNDVLLDWAKIKKDSHNKYAGLVSLWNIEDLEDEDKILYKVKPTMIDNAIFLICKDMGVNFSPEIESNILYANKYQDASLLESDSINAIVQLATIGELLEL
jgi:hypothetical protein